MAGYLLVNPRSGSAGPQLDELLDAARVRGIETHVLGPEGDAASLARDAGATALGMAGGDGSLGAVAGVAVERDLPFVCVPFGTRNHFARDIGLDPDDPIAALDAFDGAERRIDVGRVHDRVFLNNLSLGAYAHLVHRREHARRRREALARLRALGVALRFGKPLVVQLDGGPQRVAVLLVANNAYRLDLFSVGQRERVDGGLLHVYFTERLFPWRWHERSGAAFEIDAGRVRVAIDGEPTVLDGPFEVRIDPLGLRLLEPLR